MKRPLILLLAVAACAAVAVPAFAGTRTVKIGDNWFVARGHTSHTVHIDRNSTLRFAWTGHSQHNVVTAKGPERFRSPVRSSGSYSHRFTRRGTYLVLCTIHPAQMRLTVVVR